MRWRIFWLRPPRKVDLIVMWGRRGVTQIITTKFFDRLTVTHRQIPWYQNTTHNTLENQQTTKDCQNCQEQHWAHKPPRVSQPSIPPHTQWANNVREYFVRESFAVRVSFAATSVVFERLFSSVKINHDRQGCQMLTGKQLWHDFAHLY